MHQEGETLTIKELVAINGYLENSLSKSTKLTVFTSHPLAFRPMGRMFGALGNGCARCGIHGIGESIQELIFGNAARDKLEDIWKESAVLREIRKGVPKHLKGICSECIMKDVCLGNCIANNYHKNKDLWGPYWYCEEAYKAGLFPESRLVHTL